MFAEAELRQIGQTFDRAEQRMMARAAGGNDEYAQASHDGYYGLDVIVAALQSRWFNMKHFHSPEFRDLMTNPAKNGDAFILNLRDHWLAVRMVRGRWFSLDSLSAPEAISESRINSFVTTLQNQSWTLFVVRPFAWPSQKMPEPKPGPETGIPRIDDGSSGMKPAAYYSFAAISRLSAGSGSGGGGGGDYGAAMPAQQRTAPAPVERPRPVGDGRTLGEDMQQTMSAAQPAFNVDEDPELAAAIRLSIKDFKESLPALSPEPDVGLRFKITDMTTTGGSSGRFITRRFPPNAKVMELFNWLFKSDEIWPDAMVALGVCESVVLTAQYPNRTLRCVQGREVRYSDGLFTHGAADTGTKDVTSQTLADLFQNEGENLRFVYAA